jgi:hypothetical protein
MSRGYLAKCSSGGKPKKSHATLELAEAMRSAMIAKGKWTAAGSNAYWCNQCGGYHAGRVGSVHRGKGRPTVKNIPRFLPCQ